MGNRKGDKTWLAIRTAFIVKRWSAQKCADEFHVDVTTIKKRASKEGWARERHRNATAGHSVAEEEIRQAVRLEADKRQELLDALALRADSRIKVAETALDKIRNPRSIVSATRDYVEMVDRLMKAIKAAGEDLPIERDDTLIIETRRLEPVKVAVGEDGRLIDQLLLNQGKDAGG